MRNSERMTSHVEIEINEIFFIILKFLSKTKILSISVNFPLFSWILFQVLSPKNFFLLIKSIRFWATLDFSPCWIFKISISAKSRQKKISRQKMSMRREYIPQSQSNHWDTKSYSSNFLCLKNLEKSWPDQTEISNI